jgi:hypothetical protein
MALFTASLAFLGWWLDLEHSTYNATTCKGLTVNTAMVVIGVWKVKGFCLVNSFVSCETGIEGRS